MTRNEEIIKSKMRKILSSKHAAACFSINRGFKCDAPECDYISDTIDLNELPNWLNSSCPKCGANLFTEEDALAWIVVMQSIMNPITRFITAIARLFKLSKNYRITFDGTGMRGIKFNELPRID
jgi:hypothetical protein